MKKMTEKRTMVYLPGDLYEKAKDAASRSGKSLSGLVRDALQKVVDPPVTKEEYLRNLHEAIAQLKGVFKEDGLTYQRRLRAEWDEREKRLEPRFAELRKNLASHSGH